MVTAPPTVASPATTRTSNGHNNAVANDVRDSFDNSKRPSRLRRRLARIVRFTGTPKAIVRGESAKLSYKLENAERASIDPSIGEVDSAEGILVFHRWSEPNIR